MKILSTRPMLRIPLCLLLVLSLAGVVRAAPALAPASEGFQQIVRDSYEALPGADPAEFSRWLAALDPGPNSPAGGCSLLCALARIKAEREQAPSSGAAAALEAQTAAWLHGLIKRSAPRFNLDGGYEFFNLVRRGERQCFLQSLLMGSLMEEAGLTAGVVMVNRSERGTVSNNGHAALLLWLADGRAALVDASWPEPLVRHQAILLRQGEEYRYASPLYEGRSPIIRSFKPASGGAGGATGRFQPLPLAFLRSQLACYRGERIPGGPVLGKPTAKGLGEAEIHLRSAVRLCPSNGLALSLLTRTLLLQKRPDEAGPLLAQARAVYSEAGWMPVLPVVDSRGRRAAGSSRSSRGLRARARGARARR